ncbi:MAG: patatin-like phospholipase family protein [Nitrososphaeraceae archaeon]
MKEVSYNEKDKKPKPSPTDSDLPQEKPIAYAGPKQIVYEGSQILLEGSCNLDQEEKPNQSISYSWSLDPQKSDNKQNLQISLRPAQENPRNVTFTAPYVDFDPSKSDNKTYISLVFKLVVTDKNTGLNSDPSWVTIIVKMIQRALILQGGGSLGAYEIGAFKALCKQLIDQDKRNNARNSRPLFDIVAGTSIGALNAALIVNSVKQRMQDGSLKGENDKTWYRSVSDLEGFWNDITFSIPIFENHLFELWWNFLHITTTNIHQIAQKYQNLFGSYNPYILKPENNTFNPFYLCMRPDMYTPAADPEAARRFFSWLYFPYIIPNKVITPSFPQPDSKFFTGVPRFMRFDNSALARMARDRGYWDYEIDPIKTEFQRGEPRLLIVAIDIQDATSTVTFDSYLCESKYKDGTRQKSYHVIRYPKGITMKHVRAGMSPHTAIDYPWLEDEPENGNNGRKRYFWDGAYLSNSPLREVLHLHRYYWYTMQKNNVENDDELHVPHLEVYIVNLYPIVEEEQNKPPRAPDIIQDRNLDIRFHDKTRYDVKVSEMITDYLILHGQLKNLAMKQIGIFEDKSKIQEFEDAYQHILNGLTHSEKRSGDDDDVINRRNESIPTNSKSDRTYRDLIEGRFDVVRVIYIDRKDDKETIFGKAADFSKETMYVMKKRGYDDACDALNAIWRRKSSQSYKIEV